MHCYAAKNISMNPVRVTTEHVMHRVFHNNIVLLMWSMYRQTISDTVGTPATPCLAFTKSLDKIHFYLIMML